MSDERSPSSPPVPCAASKVYDYHRSCSPHVTSPRRTHDRHHPVTPGCFESVVRTHTVLGDMRAAVGIPGTRTVLCGDRSGTIRQRDAVSGHLIPDSVILQCESIVLSMLLASDLTLWVGVTNGKVFVFDATSFELLHEAVVHKGGVHALVEDISRRRVITAGGDWKISCIDIARKAPSKALSGHSNGVKCLCVLNDSLYSGSDDRTARRWHLGGEGDAPPPPPKLFRGHTKSVVALVAVANKLWTASDDWSVRVWDAEEAVCTRVIESHSGPVTHLFYVGGILWSCGNDGNVILYDIQKETAVRTMPLKQPTVGTPDTKKKAAHMTLAGAIVNISSCVVWTASTDGLSIFHQGITDTESLRLRAFIDSLRAELADRTSECSILGAEIQSLRQETSMRDDDGFLALEQQLSIQKEERALQNSLEDELGQLRRRHEETLRSHRAEIDVHKKEAKHLLELFQVESFRGCDADAQRAQMSSAIQTLQAERDSLTEQLTAVTETLSDFAAQAEAHMATPRRASSASDSQLLEMQSVLISMQSQLAQYRDANAMLEQERTTMMSPRRDHSQLLEMQSALIAMQNQNAMLEQECSALRLSPQRGQDQLLEMQSAVIAMQSQVAQYQDLNAELEQECSGHRNQLQQFSTHFEALQQQVAEKDAFLRFASASPARATDASRFSPARNHHHTNQIEHQRFEMDCQEIRSAILEEWSMQLLSIMGAQLHELFYICSYNTDTEYTLASVMDRLRAKDAMYDAKREEAADLAIALRRLQNESRSRSMEMQEREEANDYQFRIRSESVEASVQQLTDALQTSTSQNDDLRSDLAILGARREEEICRAEYNRKLALHHLQKLQDEAAFEIAALTANLDQKTAQFNEHSRNADAQVERMKFALDHVERFVSLLMEDLNEKLSEGLLHGASCADAIVQVLMATNATLHKDLRDLTCSEYALQDRLLQTTNTSGSAADSLRKQVKIAQEETQSLKTQVAVERESRRTAAEFHRQCLHDIEGEHTLVVRKLEVENQAMIVKLETSSVDPLIEEHIRGVEKSYHQQLASLSEIHEKDLNTIDLLRATLSQKEMAMSSLHQQSEDERVMLQSKLNNEIERLRSELFEMTERFHILSVEKHGALDSMESEKAPPKEREMLKTAEKELAMLRDVMVGLQQAALSGRHSEVEREKDHREVVRLQHMLQALQREKQKQPPPPSHSTALELETERTQRRVLQQELTALRSAMQYALSDAQSEMERMAGKIREQHSQDAHFLHMEHTEEIRYLNEEISKLKHRHTIRTPSTSPASKGVEDLHATKLRLLHLEKLAETTVDPHKKRDLMKEIDEVHKSVLRGMSGQHRPSPGISVDQMSSTPLAQKPHMPQTPQQILRRAYGVL